MTVHAVSALPPGTPPDIAEFLAHWASLRREGLVPLLGDYLDGARVHLQPFVMISAIIPPDVMKVRLMGTGLVALLGQDATGGTIEQYYTPEIQDSVRRAVGLVITLPAGYLCVRTVQTQSGLVLSSPSVCLPLLNPSSPGQTFISYTHVDRALATLAAREHLSLVQDLRVTHWIDVGAGVPPWTFT